jgi:RNase P/RNase MRP subunit POP5
VRPRRRYVCVRAEPPVPAPQLEAVVQAALRKLPVPRAGDVARRTFHVMAGACIVRVEPAAKEPLRALLADARAGDARVRTVATSGTIRAAREALGAPPSPPPPKLRAAAKGAAKRRVTASSQGRSRSRSGTPNSARDRTSRDRVP